MEVPAAAKLSKSSPIPTRFDEPEDAFLQEVKRLTGIPTSELIRRSVRFLRREGADAQKLSAILMSLSA